MSTSQRRNGNGHPAWYGYGLEQPFDADSLVALRSTVAAHADSLGLDEDAVADLILAVHELAANAVRHGGGGGLLRMWVSYDHVVCEVTDQGDGFTYVADRRSHPPLGAQGGRGLWIVAQLAAWFDISSSPAGTVATVAIALS
jgi:anti-sigma regulatory factor (Ser/Thr protein kinase)